VTRVRLGVTGAAGDLGTALLRAAVAEPQIDEVIAIDVRPPRLEHEKVRAVTMDVRDKSLADVVRGCDAVAHTAFVIFPRHREAEAHDINQNGSRNVLESASAAGVRRLVVASSMAVYGTPEKLACEVDEEAVPRESHSAFYSREKGDLERMLVDWENAHPGALPHVTRFRPGFLYGRDFDNVALRAMLDKISVVPDDGGRFQLVHQSDAARAFLRACLVDAPGAFNLTTDDALSAEEMAAMHGQRIVRVPTRLARWALDVLYALRLAPFDGDFAISGDPIGPPVRARAVLGWAPTLSSRESAYALLLSRGRAVRYLDGALRPEVVEAALDAHELPGGAKPAHRFLPADGRTIHVEIHGRGHGSTLVIVPPLGADARTLRAFALELAARGANALLVDLPGHGLSEGARGRARRKEAEAAIASTMTFARAEFGGPLALYAVGTSARLLGSLGSGETPLATVETAESAEALRWLESIGRRTAAK
jgi:nucleoside-diphosphate-sugar epimerase